MKIHHRARFSILPFFGLFWLKKQKTAKIVQKWRKLPKSKLFDKIFWNLVCRYFPKKENPTKKLFFDFGNFWPFLAKKQPKNTKNEENWQNSNRLVKFSKLWYVDASQQKKMLQKNYFSISAFFYLFWPKNSQNWLKIKKIGKIQNVW